LMLVQPRQRLLVYLPMDEAGEQALAWLDQH
ncbi:hypothetical protein, partial [Klebsiella pneumoniae]